MIYRNEMLIVNQMIKFARQIYCNFYNFEASNWQSYNKGRVYKKETEGNEGKYHSDLGMVCQAGNAQKASSHNYGDSSFQQLT